MLKKSFIIARMQLLSWLTNKYMFTLLFLVMFIDTQITAGMCENARQMGERLNIFEPFIATSNVLWTQMAIPIVYLVLMYEFPHKYGNSIFYLVRSGRREWFLAQMIFSIVSAFIYLTIVYIITVILSVGNIQLGVDWSLPVTKYMEVFPDRINVAAYLIKPSTYYQGLPMMVFIYNFVFLLINLVVLNMLQLLLFGLNFKKIGMAFCIGFEMVGAVLCSVTENIKWFFPTANSVFGEHFEDYIRKPKCQLSFSMLYFGVCFLTLFICGMKAIENCRMANCID